MNATMDSLAADLSYLIHFQSCLLHSAASGDVLIYDLEDFSRTAFPKLRILSLVAVRKLMKNFYLVVLLRSCTHGMLYEGGVIVRRQNAVVNNYR